MQQADFYYYSLFLLDFLYYAHFRTHVRRLYFIFTFMARCKFFEIRTDSILKIFIAGVYQLIKNIVKEFISVFIEKIHCL